MSLINFVAFFDGTIKLSEEPHQKVQVEMLLIILLNFPVLLHCKKKVFKKHYKFKHIPKKFHSDL